MPCRERDKRLHRKIEFRAKPSAHRGWDDSNLIRCDVQDFCDVGAIHVGRLRARLNFDAVSDAPREARFRFNISVLDEAGLVFVFNDYIRLGQRALDIASNNASSCEHVSGTTCMYELGSRL